MKQHANLLWITAFVLGWLFDFLFWGQSIGINFAIYSALFVVGGLLLLGAARQRPALGLLWLVPPLLFFITVPVIRTEPMTVSLSIVFAVLILGVFAVSYLGGRWPWYSLADYIAAFFKLLGGMLAGPLRLQYEIRKEEKEGTLTRSRLNLWPVLRGLILAAPVVAIFAALLTSADTIFSKGLNDFIKLFFDIDKIPEYIFRLFYILILGYALSGVFIHAGSRSRDETLLGQEKPLVPRFLGFAESAIVMGSVIVLFAAFVIVQFRYFFGGQVNLGVGGLTDSEYARRGFGELATVAFLSLLLILGLSTISRRSNTAQQRVFSGLSVGLVSSVMIILVSAYQRLRLNELAHGFFRLRTYSHVFYIWLALLLAAVAILEILHRERAFALAALIAAMGFAASLAVLNVDRFTARQSVMRATYGYYLNIPDNASLSTDSVPALVDDFLSPSLLDGTRQRVGAILMCRLNAQPAPVESESRPDWRSFNLSRSAAEAALKKARPYLVGYSINTKAWPMRVRTPGIPGYFECQNYSYYPD